MSTIVDKIKEKERNMKKLLSKGKNTFKKVVSGLNIALCSLILSTNSVYAAGSNTSSIDGFITFVCDWLLKIGGVVALIGAVMFALGWQRDDAEGKSRGLMTMMAGFMVIAISQSKGLFGL
ncbi:MAG: hypothetical protein IJ565_06045 [Bacilli bacterium]|nr:hypothetical protein [Bacilli bacterium]